MPHNDYRAIDFRPALAAGWRVFYMDDAGKVTSLPVVGWLVMEQAPISADGRDAHSDVPVENRDRLVVAGVHRDGWASHVVPANWHAEPWLVRGPDLPDPDRSQIRAEKERREEAALTKPLEDDEE
ncbi:hypothetical protein U2F26_34045 [Micromonospora sp. 4G57]|uniref:Uncharacterized protein n=1 Tax=Micromonospora sicca TaxID=2202420 RepID=A0ABU5JP20_9ACTN|nr:MULTISPECIES: hypothetical protein [unclassified Micromonospora]MDZ5447672.1 hypothetical protein [Micromonospora sp. 4G57]MDZ5494368.1 hypothetical protein [Micromonospora sp. 4G53]